MGQLSVWMMKFVNSLSIGLHWHHGFGAECYEVMKDDSRGSLLQGLRSKGEFIGTLCHDLLFQTRKRVVT
jgi:hypothetical protein